MEFTGIMNHEGSVDGDLFCTTFKWSLNHWSLCYNYYKEPIYSPKFKVIGAEGCECYLRLHGVGNKNREASKVLVTLTAPQPYYLRACISIVNKKMEKLLESKPIQINELASTASIDLGIWLNPLLQVRFLHDDTLTLFFELRLVKNMKQTITKNISSSIFDDDLRDKLGNFCDVSEFSDVTFMVRRVALPASKLILAARSKIFEAMFKSKMKEQIDGVVRIDDVDARIFKIFLRCMYTGKFEDVGDAVNELVLVADKYEVLGLVDRCTEYMAANLNVENAVQYLITGDRLSCTKLVESAIKFIKWNKKVLDDSVNYDFLSKHPHLIARVLSE